MATQTHFDLNDAIERWRKELAAQPQLTRDDRRELEDHLVSLIAEFCMRGMSKKEAFRLAHARMGSPRKLNKEFRKASGRRWNLWRIMAACTFMFVCCLWIWSYCAKHSLKYGSPNWNMTVLIDRGIVQFQLNHRNIEDDALHANSFLYNPRVGFESGFQWDEHRRHAASGRESLKAWGPKTGLSGFLAKYGFASWSMTWGQALRFGPSFRSRIVFMPFWFLALMAAVPVLAMPLAVQNISAITFRWGRLRVKQANSLWKLKPVST